jgi:hypothetical protein
LDLNRHLFSKYNATACRTTGVPPIERLNNYRISPASVTRITKWILTGEVEIVLNVFAKKGKHEIIPVRLRRSTESTAPETTEILPRMIQAPSFL